MLAFMHVPKAAGTSLTYLLRNLLGAPFCLGSTAQIDEFLRRPRAQRSTHRMVAGHMPFGLHHHVDTRCTYATFLRDPVTRVWSNYHYLRWNRNNPLHKHVCSMSFDDFLEWPEVSITDNGQVRMLMNHDWHRLVADGIHWSESEPFGCLSAAHLEAAKQNLRHCDFVGLFEHLDEDAGHLLESLGLPPAELPALNRTPYPTTAAVTDAQRARAAQRNALDIELYRYALELRGRRRPPLGARGLTVDLGGLEGAWMTAGTARVEWECGGFTAIEAPPGNFEYLALSPTFDWPGSRGFCAIDVDVDLEEGTFSIGLLDVEQNTLSAILPVTRQGRSTARLWTGHPPRRACLVLSNHCEIGQAPARFKLGRLDLHAWRESPQPSVRAGSDAVNRPVGAGPLRP